MADVKLSMPPATITMLDEKRTDANVTDPAQSLDEHNLTDKPLPYWLVNVPRSEWTTECPSFLRDLNERLINSLSTPIEQFRRADWARVKELVQSNRMDLFRRPATDTRKYLKAMDSIRAEYSSVVRFIIKERVCWGDELSEIQPRGKPFENDEDIRILYNDWPYGIDTDIIHLIVWTKFPFEDDPITGEITANTRAAIESYVQRKFAQVPSDKLVWFRNWTALKTVPGLEHFHVMLYQPDMEFIREITRGDVPMIQRV